MLTWSDVSQRPPPLEGERIAYGPGPSQFGELRVPTGQGPHPVVVLIHGGCWQSAFNYRYLLDLADALTREGYATWTIEYRRLGEDGAGWPGTFLDVGAALDRLRPLAPGHHLDLGRVVTVGHSAGGQLALWLAARPRLPAGSAIRGARPLPVRGVVGLAAITDLAEYRVGPADSCHAAVDPLMGGSPGQVPMRYARASPRALLPLRVRQVLIQGRRDPIVSADSVAAYAAAARAAGDDARVFDFADGHFDAVVPEGTGWDLLRRALVEIL